MIYVAVRSKIVLNRSTNLSTRAENIRIVIYYFYQTVNAYDPKIVPAEVLKSIKNDCYNYYINIRME